MDIRYGPSCQVEMDLIPRLGGKWGGVRQMKTEEIYYRVDAMTNRQVDGHTVLTTVGQRYFREIEDTEAYARKLARTLRAKWQTPNCGYHLGRQQVAAGAHSSVYIEGHNYPVSTCLSFEQARDRFDRA